MNTQLCSEKDCAKPVKVIKRGLCGTHYQRWSYENRPKGKKPCGVENCSDHRYAKGYCRKHYTSLRAHGVPVLPPKPKTFCEKHPDRQAHTKNMCKSCYASWYYTHGLARGPVKKRARKEDCGYANAHYRIRADRGHPRQYECSQDNCSQQAENWALRHDAKNIRVEQAGRMAGSYFSTDPWDYSPMCRPCHNAYDKAEGPKKKNAGWGNGARHADYLKWKAKVQAS